MMPWKLYADAAAYIFTWLIGYSSLMGAIGGILIADYWVLRRRRAVARRICSSCTAPTRYSDGVNPRAIVALVVAMLPVVPGFVRAATTPGGNVADPDVLRYALHLRVVRDLRAECGDVPGADERENAGRRLGMEVNAGEVSEVPDLKNGETEKTNGVNGVGVGN